MLNQALYDRIASGDLHLTDTEHRVWAALIAKATVNNYVNEAQVAICAAYKLEKAAVSRAIKKLIENDMLIKTYPDDGRGARMMLSPFHFWKGNAADHREGMKIYAHLAKAGKAKRNKAGLQGS